MIETVIDLIKKRSNIIAAVFLFAAIYYLGQFVAGQKYLYLAMLFVLAIGLTVLLRPKKIFFTLIALIPFSFVVKLFLIMYAPGIVASVAGIYKDVLVIFLFGALISIVFTNKHYIFRLSKLHLPIIVFTALCFLLFLVNSQTFLIGAIGFRRTVMYAFLFFFVLYLFKSLKDIRLFTACVLTVGFIAAIATIVQIIMFPETLFQASGVSGGLLYSMNRANSFFDSPNDLAFYLAYITALFVGLINYSNRSRLTILYSVALIVLSLALVMTLSRGAWVSLFLGIFFWGLIKYKLMIKRLGFIIILALMMILIFFSNPLVVNRFNSIFDPTSGSRQSRITKFYQYTKFDDLRSFLFGHGLGATGSVPEAFKAQGLSSNFIDIYYVELYQDIGVIGLGCYFWVLWACVSYFIKLERRLDDYFLKGLVNGLVIATFTYVFSGLFFTIGGFFATASLFWSYAGIAVIIDRYHAVDSLPYNDVNELANA